MLTLYLISLGLGGTLLTATMVLGGDHSDHEVEADHDFELDHDVDAHVAADADADADGDHDADGGLDAALAWLPVTSLRFWTYFLAFFGLTGTALTSLGLMGGPKPIGLAAGGMGYIAGFSIVRILGRLRKADATSGIRASDFVGHTAKVRVRISKGDPGQVRLHAVNGRVVDLIAETDEDEFAADEEVMIYAVTAGGGVMVTKQDKLEDES